MDFERRILESLVQHFNSKPGQHTFAVSTTTIWPDYLGKKNGSPNLDFDNIHKLHFVIEKGIAEGLFSSKKDSRGNFYRQISADARQVALIAKRIGAHLRPEYDDCMRAILERFCASPWPQVASWCANELGGGNLKGTLSLFKFEPYSNLVEVQAQLRSFLAACEGVCALTEDTPVREFSAKYFNGSKDLERHYEHKIACVLAPEMVENKVEDKEILKTLHLLHNPALLMVKGAGQIVFKNGDVLTLTGRAAPVALSKVFIDDIVRISAQCVLTIENLTTFHSFPCGGDWLIVYNSGYANHNVVSFIQKVASDNCMNETWHFGDLDAFGFDILRNLAVRTGVRVVPYCMGVAFYLRHQDCAVNMSVANRNLLEKLLGDPYFSEEDKNLFRMLLDDNCILEQEAVSVCSL